MSYISGPGGVTSTDTTARLVGQQKQGHQGAWSGMVGGRWFVPDLYPRHPIVAVLMDRQDSKAGAR